MLRRAVRRALAPVLDSVRQPILTTLSRKIDDSRVVYCGDHVVIARIAGRRKIYLDMRDVGVAAHLALGQVWEPHVSRVLAHVTKGADNFFDVGANFGYHTLMLADVVAPRAGAFHLFEPNPPVAQCLRRSLAVNGLDHAASLNECAVSDAKGRSHLTVLRDRWASSSLQSAARIETSGHPWQPVVESTVEVAVTTLDDYCAEHGVEEIGVMKIDVEGHEEAVLRGARDILARSSRLRLVMEFTFDAYDDPDSFWESLCEVFPSRFCLHVDGSVTPIRRLRDLRRLADVELTDVLFSKDPGTAF